VAREASTAAAILEHGAGVFDLQSVGRAFVVVKRCGPQAFLAVCDHEWTKLLWTWGNESRGGGNYQTRKEKIFAALEMARILC
jgi:hypothetical protein